MKIKQLISWIALSAAVSPFLWSCTQELDGPQTVTPGTASAAEGYLSFSLKDTDAENLGALSTKAPLEGDSMPTIDGIFNAGSVDERAISPDTTTNAILLFNEDDSWFGYTRLELVQAADGPHYLCLIHYTDNQLPAKLLAVLNAEPAFIDELTAALADESKYPRGFSAVRTAMQWLTTSGNASCIDENGDSYLTMTSSVYGSNRDFTILAPAPLENERTLGDYVFPKPELAAENPLTIYVERMVAKFTLSFLDGELNDKAPLFLYPDTASKVQYLEDWVEGGMLGSDESEDHRWKVHVVNWGLNAVEPNTFLFKNMTNVPGATLVDESFRFKFWWNTFNPDTRPRSYWAVDQHYGGGAASPFGGTRAANRYPAQYRRIDGDAEASKDSYETDPFSAWSLDYFPFDAIAGSLRSDSKYGIENTFDPEGLGATLEDDGHLRVGTHILLAAQLLIEGVDKNVYENGRIGAGHLLTGSSETDTVTTKYYDGAQFLSEKAMIKRAVYNLINQIYGEKGHTIKIDGQEFTYASALETFYNASGRSITLDNALDYFELVGAQIKGGDGWVTIAPKKDVSIHIYYRDNGTYRRKEIPEEHLKQLIADLVAPVRAYTNGRMYYAIPVLHEKQFDANGKFDASVLEIGDVGVVRNHWYRVTVGKLNALGTPVHDPGQPIIPNHEPEFKSLGVQIEILPWSRIEIPDVIL